MYKEVCQIAFPKYKGNLNINMMPFIFGDNESLPKEFHSYLSIIDKCSLDKNKIAYLTINESFVEKGKSQRRQGLHTEATKDFGWGEGGWGKSGVFMASNDGSCRIYDCLADDVDEHGSMDNYPDIKSEQMKPNFLYWLTDRTPHEALKVDRNVKRQYIRVVSDKIGVWWAKHSTANPLGIQPNCKILNHSKFI